MFRLGLIFKKYSKVIGPNGPRGGGELFPPTMRANVTMTP